MMGRPFSVANTLHLSHTRTRLPYSHYALLHHSADDDLHRTKEAEQVEDGCFWTEMAQAETLRYPAAALR